MSGGIAAVIVCRDRGRALLETLTSVQQQTRQADEIVVVDDGSTEIYTRQVLARLERGGIRVARACGISAARNCGARLTTGDYLMWLAADDSLEPGYFEAAAVHLDSNPDLDFVSCALRIVGDAASVWSPTDTTFISAAATYGVPHAATLLRRRLWARVGGFDENVSSYELLDFWASAYEVNAQGIVLDEPFLSCRARPEFGYQRSMQPAAHVARLKEFYAKHRASVERYGMEIIQAKAAFLLCQRQHQQSLEPQPAVLEAEITRLRSEIAETARALESHGLSRVNWGDLKRSQPLSKHWGWDRGTPVDRLYIDDFLEGHRADIRGRVLEVRDSVYTRRFGGDKVSTPDVIDIDPTNYQATVVADLRRAVTIETDTYDCILLTQTLQVIDDPVAVLVECARILRPGGVLLATATSVSMVDEESGRDGDHWRLTEASARRLLAHAFPIDAFDVRSSGNLVSCVAHLYGLTIEEMEPADLAHSDWQFPLVITIRAVKPGQTTTRPQVGSSVSI